MNDNDKKWLDIENDGRLRKILDKYINGFFGLSDLNYIKPFRRLIHMLLIRLHIIEVRVDEIEDSPSMEEFEDLEKRVATNEDNIEGLDETKADKEDLENLEGRVDDLDAEIDDLQSEIDETNGNLSELEERVKTNEENIENLDEVKADKTDLNETNERVTTLEECCEEVGEHLETIDGRLDTDEENIDTLLDSMIVLTGHDGIIATDTYFENIYDIQIDDLLMQMLNAGIMEYCVYTAVYEDWDNWVKQIQGAVKSIYGYEWNNFAFINVRRVQFGGTSPRPMIELIPRERDVYICLDYTGDDFVGHCFMHRTDLKELEERMTAAEERLDTDEENIAANTSDIERLTEDMEHTGERLTDIERAIEALQQADTDFETRISYLEECCSDVKTTIGHLEDDIEDCRKHADEAVKEAEEAKEDAEQAAKDAEEAKEKAEEAAEKVDQFDGRITKNEEDIAELQECCESVQTRLETDEANIADNTTKIEELEENKADKDDIPTEYLQSFHRTYEHSDDDNTEYVNVYVTDNNGSSTHAYSGDMSGLSVEETNNSDGSTTYTLTPQFVGGSSTAARTYKGYEIIVPAGYDDSEVRALIEALQTRVENNETSIADIEKTIEEIKGEIPTEYLTSYGGNYISSEDDKSEYSVAYAKDNNGDQVNVYSGDMSALDVEKTDNADGSTTYKLTPQFVGGTAAAERNYGSYEITVPAGYDDSEVRALIEALQTRVENNETSIEEIENSIENIQEKMLVGLDIVHSYGGSYGYRAQIEGLNSDGTLTTYGYAGRLSDIRISRSDDDEGRGYALTECAVNSSGDADSIEVGKVSIPVTVSSSEGSQSYDASYPIAFVTLANLPNIGYAYDYIETGTNKTLATTTRFAGSNGKIGKGDSATFAMHLGYDPMTSYAQRVYCCDIHFSGNVYTPAHLYYAPHVSPSIWLELPLVISDPGSTSPMAVWDTSYQYDPYINLVDEGVTVESVEYLRAYL